MKGGEDEFKTTTVPVANAANRVGYDRRLSLGVLLRVFRPARRCYAFARSADCVVLFPARHDRWTSVLLAAPGMEHNRQTASRGRSGISAIPALRQVHCRPLEPDKNRSPATGPDCSTMKQHVLLACHQDRCVRIPGFLALWGCSAPFPT